MFKFRQYLGAIESIGEIKPNFLELDSSHVENTSETFTMTSSIWRYILMVLSMYYNPYETVEETNNTSAIVPFTVAQSTNYLSRGKKYNVLSPASYQYVYLSLLLPIPGYIIVGSGRHWQRDERSIDVLHIQRR
jgi:hypothetical protein